MNCPEWRARHQWLLRGSALPPEHPGSRRARRSGTAHAPSALTSDPPAKAPECTRAAAGASMCACRSRKYAGSRGSLRPPCDCCPRRVPAAFGKCCRPPRSPRLRTLYRTHPAHQNLRSNTLPHRCRHKHRKGSGYLHDRNQDWRNPPAGRHWCGCRQLRGQGRPAR